MQFEIVIPTRNGGRWLGQLLEAYRKLGVEPLYIVDERTNDNTHALLRKMNARFVDYLPRGDFVESGMIEAASQFATKEWIFRFDDDEFPSSELLRWANEVACQTDADGWSISRLTLLNVDHEIKYSRIETQYYSPVPDLCGPLVRLFRHRHVEYSSIIHSPGFASKRPWQFAPATAYFLHLDILLRSAGERLEKLRRYEEIEPNSSWRFAYHYLPDLFPEIDQKPAPLPTDEFDDLLASLPLPAEQPYALNKKERAQMQVSAEEFTTIYKRRWRRQRSPLARKKIAEFFCTLGKSVTSVECRLPARFNLGHFIHDYGTDLFSGAESRAYVASCVLPETTKSTGPKGQSAAEQWSQ